MSDIVVQDNFLDEEYFKELQFGITSPQFPWYMSGIISGYSNVEGNVFFPSDDYQMVHTVYNKDGDVEGSEYLFQFTDFYNQLRLMFSAMDMYSCQRVKVNLLKRQNKIIEGGMHIDMYDSPFNSLTSVLYMNTNNGYTRLETGEKIESVANRLVTFPTRIKHTGSTNNCDALYRCILNINWIKKEQD